MGGSDFLYRLWAVVLNLRETTKQGQGGLGGQITTYLGCYGLPSLALKKTSSSPSGITKRAISSVESLAVKLSKFATSLPLKRALDRGKLFAPRSRT
jgi:hypothetical protein